MGIIDQFSKAATQAVDRARFETEKFRRTNRLQSELTSLKQQLDHKLLDLGNRTHELYYAGQIQPALFADLVVEIDRLRSDVARKQEELRIAQEEVFVEPPEPEPQSPDQAAAQSRSVPIQDPADSLPRFKNQATSSQSPAGTEKPPNAAPASGTARKTCPACSFQMPAQAVFCPNCGFRVGTTPLT